MIRFLNIIILFCLLLGSSCFQPLLPEKKIGAISGVVEFAPGLINQEDLITITVENNEGKIIVSKELKNLKTIQEYAINDIPIPDYKNDLDVTVRFFGKCCDEQMKTKITKSQVTRLNNIKFYSGNPVDDTGANLINGRVIDENGNPIDRALVSNITGGVLNEETKVANSTTTTTWTGRFFFYSTVFPITLEISANGKIMKITLQKNNEEVVNYKLVSNARTVSGQIFDAKDKTKVLPNIKVKILNEDITSKTNNEGKFELRGVPLNEVTLSVNDSLNIAVPKVSASEVRILDNIYYPG